MVKNCQYFIAHWFNYLGNRDNTKDDVKMTELEKLAAKIKTRRYELAGKLCGDTLDREYFAINAKIEAYNEILSAIREVMKDE